MNLVDFYKSKGVWDAILSICRTYKLSFSGFHVVSDGEQVYVTENGLRLIFERQNFRIISHDDHSVYVANDEGLTRVEWNEDGVAVAGMRPDIELLLPVRSDKPLPFLPLGKFFWSELGHRFWDDFWKDLTKNGKRDVAFDRGGGGFDDRNLRSSRADKSSHVDKPERYAPGGYQRRSFRWANRKNWN